MAVGNVGEPADRELVDLVGGTRRAGARGIVNDEAKVSEAMKSPNIALKADLGLGRGKDRVLTCDLTSMFVINGDDRS